ncbi:Radical SAM protein OS=Streptomyces rimosus subsp. rimosus (strain ATCC / DSM 40260/ JCM 4667 / NRRL 2234) OX=1265868 GN=SRIM_000365 PE=4 SV=1 [Streptomyces rimosus subsp. rimosus]
MADVCVLLDCYTVEPSGLGVPPYVSTYVRAAWSALRRARPGAEVRYLTIDDVRWCLAGGKPEVAPPVSDPRTYSATVNRERAIALLHDAEAVVVVAGDKVPSVHLHAVNGSLEEICRALACVRGRRYLLGPLATYARISPYEFAGLFDAVHTHSVTSGDLVVGSRVPTDYGRLRAERGSFAGLVEQMCWRPIAELELYRGCTRRVFCDFCNEPGKAPVVAFRSVEDVLEEAQQLYAARVRHFRLGSRPVFSPTATVTRRRSGRCFRGSGSGARSRWCCTSTTPIRWRWLRPSVLASPVWSRSGARRATVRRWVLSPLTGM